MSTEHIKIKTAGESSPDDTLAFVTNVKGNYFLIDPSGYFAIKFYLTKESWEALKASVDANIK